MTADLDVLERVKVQYVTLPGWKKPIKECKSFEELPAECQAYVETLEKLTGIKVRWIGVGPGRAAMIDRL